MTEAEALRALARRLMPQGFGCAVLPLDQPAPPLLPAEAEAVARAVPKRRQEFAIGRAALRLAIAEAGHVLAESRAIPPRSDRQPDLPPGLRASLSHSGAHCVAVAAPAGGPSIGIDIEPCDRKPPDGLAKVVAPYRMSEDLPLLAFCVKEAMFKAQYPLTGRMLDFSAVPAVLRGERVRACMGARLIGARWGIAGGYYLSISLWRG
ncbi:4'-phosphopantetheinyl transferase family protein [Paracoccus laeviglucosivorans]|uniref:4'-phosphopantetheinyl transferase EntD (Siderophore biosynthesis) n=1 Tax=Paracoccus laeviglucosivorans TaxID=1197861 RepID=A0A521DBT6_9RHOB|nr:4-phosphopantetheinyl transferase [Paracoccus laeviglucosivorans]SMO69048.1 4'-phosphopantetheinyl transferase EntD (siderophore biosynthesis) [Paracoccus laeviglucosivorans]